ncbi:hypothetical protein AB1Y20_003826 [Prymnesium parvum]|uniref:Uncharacterized protein n=1 Tax=Prymnesium parvum TaxID=97485 RepID=A0AB34J611_PRYPA
MQLLLFAASPALRMALPAMQLCDQLTSSGTSSSRKPAIATPNLDPAPTPSGSARYSSVASSKASQVAPAIVVQGGSLRTWSYRSAAVEQVQVVLCTEGRPLDAGIELWHGPDNTPCHMRVFIEDGSLRPFNAVIETPRGPNTVAIRNIGPIEFPLVATVENNYVNQPTSNCLTTSRMVQGGSLRTYHFSQNVESVQVYLRTDGRPLNARIEVLQGPNNNKQVIELYTEDGLDRPFLCFLETPGSSNVVTVVNTAPIEFPMTASVIPFSIIEESPSEDVIVGGAIGAKGFNDLPIVTRRAYVQTLADEAREKESAAKAAVDAANAARTAMKAERESEKLRATGSGVPERDAAVERQSPAPDPAIAKLEATARVAAAKAVWLAKQEDEKVAIEAAAKAKLLATIAEEKAAAERAKVERAKEEWAAAERAASCFSTRLRRYPCRQGLLSHTVSDNPAYQRSRLRSRLGRSVTWTIS